MFVGGPQARFSGWGDISGVFRRALLVTALFIRPHVRGSLILLGLRAVCFLCDFNAGSGGWAGGILGNILGPGDTNGSLISWLVLSGVAEEIGNLGLISGDTVGEFNFRVKARVVLWCIHFACTFLNV